MSVFKKTQLKYIHTSFSSYNVCIRPEAGFCCVQYQVCSDPGSFTIAAGIIDASDPLNLKAAQDTSCTSDYIDIAGEFTIGVFKHEHHVAIICHNDELSSSLS